MHSTRWLWHERPGVTAYTPDKMIVGTDPDRHASTRHDARHAQTDAPRAREPASRRPAARRAHERRLSHVREAAEGGLAARP